MVAGGLIVLIVVIAFLPKLTLVGDNLLRKRLDRAIPHESELLDDPTRWLGGMPRIGRRSRLFSAAMIGLFIASYAALITTDLIQDERPGRQLRPADWDYIALAFFACFVPVTAAMVLWLRGGDVVLRPEGPLFSYRGSSIECPWLLFKSRVEPVWLGAMTLVVPIDPDGIAQTKQLNKDGSERRGRHVNLRSCRPWSYDGEPWTKSPGRDAEFLMDDLYECELTEILELFRLLAERTPARQKSTHT